MAERGEVFRLRGRVGFGARKSEERVVVLQVDALNDVLATTLVAPLDAARAFYDRDPTAVRLDPSEAGVGSAVVVLTTQLRCLPLDRLDGTAVGRLRPSSMDAVDEALRLVLGLA